MADLGNRLYCADLIVCMHYRYENRLGRDRIEHGIRVDHACRIDRKICDGKTVSLQEFTCFQNRVVLNIRCDDMISPAPAGIGAPFYSSVVALCAAPGEDDLMWLHPYESSNSLTSMINSLFGLPAE